MARKDFMALLAVSNVCRTKLREIFFLLLRNENVSLFISVVGRVNTGALIHMVMAPLLDWVGFVVVYPLALASTLAALTTLHQYVYWNRHENNNGQTTRVGGVSALKKRSSDVGSISMKNTSNSSNLQSDYSPRIPLSTCFRLLVGTVYGATFLFAMLTLAQGQAGRSKQKLAF